MTEPGSDELLAALGGHDPMAPVEAENARRAAEEERVRAASGEDDPGRDYPAQDEPPPSDQEHPEYDPTPELIV